MRANSTFPMAWLAAVALVAVPSPVSAGPKTLAKYHVRVEDSPFRVITYADGSVKVVSDGVFGHGQSFTLREKMRAAALLATTCKVADDFWLDGKLVGRMDCAGQAVAPAEGQR